MCKNNIQLIYLTCIQCTYKFEKHKQSFLSENYEQNFPSKEHKQSNAHEKHKQSSLVMRTRVLRRPIVFLRVRCRNCVRCNILIFYENCSLKHSFVVAFPTVLIVLIVVLPCIVISSKLFCQQMHSLLKRKMLQLTLKISLYMAPTCFGPFGPSSESIWRNLAKVTVSVELLVKILR
jgi:hypothetical protein